MAGIIAKKPTAVKKQVNSRESVKQALYELEQEEQEDSKEFEQFFACETLNPEEDMY